MTAYAKYGLERPEKPTHCKCGSRQFTWDAGFKGSLEEPPEPSGWYCSECENRDFNHEENPET